MQNRCAEETRGLLKKASDSGDFPLSNRLSIRYDSYFGGKTNGFSIQVAHETLKRK